MRQILLLAFLITLVYLPVLTVQTTVSPDSLIANYFFESLSGPGDYFVELFRFNALDFQPVRDLSLALDFYVYKYFHLNIGLFQNAFLWLGICIVVQSLFRKELKTSAREAFWLTCLFAVYPLFSASVSYHFARKHMLSFFFVLLATRFLTLRKFWAMNGAFIFSLLSQPIYCLWPLWATFKNKADWKKLIPSYCAAVLIMAVNFFYYQKSQIFSFLYASKYDGIFHVGEKLRALGHYVFDLFWPYRLSYDFDLSTSHVYLGLLFLIGFLIAGQLFARARKEFWLWIFFAVFSFAVPLFNTTVVSDTYLLVAGLGLFMATFTILRDQLSKIRWLLPILLITWGATTFHEATLWREPSRFYDLRNFALVPNCSSAFRAATHAINERGSIPPKVRAFVYEHQCLQQKLVVTEAQQEWLMFLKLSFLYLDKEVAFQDKMSIFEKFSKDSYYSRMLLILILGKNGYQDEAKKQIDELKKVLSQHLLPTYNHIVATELRPYCASLNDSQCVRLLLPFTQREQKPFFD